MIDLKLLEERGVSAEAWKKIFTTPENSSSINSVLLDPVQPLPDKPTKKKPPENPVGELRRRISNRIQAGRDDNLTNYRIYYALDLLWNSPLRQVSATLLTGLMDKKFTPEAIKKTLEAWGMNLSDVVRESPDPKTQKNQLSVHIPSFVQVFVPLTRAYTSVRRAKLMNDRRMTPFFKYEPALNDKVSKLRCEVITSRVETMNRQFDYFSVVDQAVFQMLQYGRSVVFPMEEWYTEEQETFDEALATKDEKGKPVKDKKGRMVVYAKEGLRYHIPHPSRVFFDKAYRSSSINTDTGVNFAGYWKILRYGEILDNAGYYNTDKATISPWWWSGNADLFLQTVYPCRLTFPKVENKQDNDRENQVAYNLYTADHRENAVALTEYFEKLTPSQWGLGDYDYPIWARFVVAADDTIVYAAPLPYNPLQYYGYNEDENKDINPSMALEILPFEDQFSNLLTQYLCAVRQNLANVTFWDKDIIEQHEMDQIESMGDRKYWKRIFMPFSGRKALKAQHNMQQAFFPVPLAMLDTNAIVQAMKMILDILERVLQMSSQELGAAATHEQTAVEQKVIASSTSTRMQFTGVPVDEARESMKKQIYDGLMAYGSDDFYAQIPVDRDVNPELLKKIGLDWNEKDHPRDVVSQKIKVRVLKKSSLALESFTSNRDWLERQSNIEAARVLADALDRWLRGPLGPSIGPEQGIAAVNAIARLAGFPNEFNFTNQTPKTSPEQEQMALQQQMAGFLEQVKASIMGEVQKGLIPIMDKTKELEQKSLAMEEAISKVVAIIEAGNAVPPPQPSPGIPEIPPTAMPPMQSIPPEMMAAAAQQGVPVA